MKQQIKHMVDRFLGWRLPDDFHPDGGISFKKEYNEHTEYPAKHEPTGTNLFTATQAERMMEYILEDAPVDENTSDGYHTFKELYDHRITLYILLCKQIAQQPYCDDAKWGIWRSKRHSDGELCFGTGTQFVLGIGQEKGMQITYHIPVERWGETEFAETLEQAPEYDGHTSDNVIERLKSRV